MTTEKITRCIHCKTEYRYQSSGYGCNDELNDSKYCHNCKFVIITALTAVPAKFAERYVDIKTIPEFDGLSFKTILEWEKLNDDEQRASDKISFKRIFPGLINLQTRDRNSIREVRGRDKYYKYFFKVSTWDVCDEVEIEIAIEYDLINNSWTGRYWR